MIKLISLNIKKAIFNKPYHANIDITNKCNLLCRQCYHSDKVQKKDTTPLLEWKRRFRLLYSLGIRSVLLIGGEPTLRMDLMMECEKYFPHISVFTNGLIRIPKHFNHRIYLSIDGDEKVNDRIRGENVFKKAFANYSNDRRVVVNCVLSNINYNSIEPVLEIFSKTKVKGIIFDFYVPGISEDNKYVLSGKRRKECGDVLKKCLRNNRYNLLMSKEIIEAIVNSSFHSKCSVRHSSLIYSADWKKKACYRSNPDCRRCGSIAAAANYAIMKNPIKNIPLFYKLAYDV